MISVLAVDPSSVLIGWATNDPPASGAWPVRKPKQAEEARRHALVCSSAFLWTKSQIVIYQPAVLVIESGGGRMSDRCSERLRGAMLAAAALSDVAVDLVHPTSWRAWAKRTLGWTEADKSDQKDAEHLLAFWLDRHPPRG